MELRDELKKAKEMATLSKQTLKASGDIWGRLYQQQPNKSPTEQHTKSPTPPAKATTFLERLQQQ